MQERIYKRTKETRIKMSISAKNRPSCSEKTKDKMRLIMKGNKRAFRHKHIASEETRKKISAANTGKIKLSPSEETRRKISLAQKGKAKSEETKEKMEIARRNRVFPFKDTKIEVTLQNILMGNNIKFEKHKNLIGQPDIFIEPNICVFADGDYWHRNPLKFESDYCAGGWVTQKVWDKDKKITEKLQNQGYIVLRFWESQIKKYPNECFCVLKTVFHRSTRQIVSSINDLPKKQS